MLSIIRHPVEAAPNDVIINEIMYDPGSNNQEEEFLELYNTTGASIDLEGWCFSDGITLVTAHADPRCFEAGTSIDANGYIIVSPNPTVTNSTYSETAVASYAGSQLSNGGETITLIDDTTQIIDTVSYDDSPPWPTSPDGDGPSLELIEPSSDNNLASSWGASIGGATPNQENSWASVTTPIITNVTDPNDISASESVNITAEVTAEDSVNLKYIVNFEDEETIAMADDGASNDGSAGDGVYGATIPGQSAGDLVRFKIEATNNDGTSTSPGNDDSINYHGYTIDDPSVTSSGEIIQWFIEDADYTQMVAESDTSAIYSCIIAYGDQVYDNSEVRVKGNNTRTFPKHNFKFWLPNGYKIQLDGAERQVDEFHYNADYRAEQITKTATLWWVAEESGMPTPDVLVTQLQKNGEFEGAYLFIDKYENSWQEDFGYDNGQLFEDYFEIINGADNRTDLDDWRDNMRDTDPHAESTRDYVLDNNDIPLMINAMTFPPLVNHLDHTDVHNIYFFRNNDNYRWSMLHWDLDLALKPSGPKTLISPHDTYGAGQDNRRWYYNAIYDQPDLRQAYLRRLRTLIDKFYTNDEFLDKYNELADEHADLIAQDNIKWPSPQRITKEDNLASIERLRETFLAYLIQDWAIPGAQTDTERQQVEIATVNPDGNNADEYIRLTNNSSSAVDISNWLLEEIGYTIPAGSVIPGNSDIYILRDDIGYRATHDSVLVAGQYETSLNSSGNLTLKTDTDQEIDVHAY